MDIYGVLVETEIEQILHIWFLEYLGENKKRQIGKVFEKEFGEENVIYGLKF